MTGRPKQFNQDVLLAKAVECFWREGYQGVSIRDVATAAGVTTGTLYNEYGGKDHRGGNRGGAARRPPEQRLLGAFRRRSGRAPDGAAAGAREDHGGR